MHLKYTTEYSISIQAVTCVIHEYCPGMETVYMSAVLETRQSMPYTPERQILSVLLYGTSYNQFCSNQSMQCDLRNDIIGEWSKF